MENKKLVMYLISTSFIVGLLSAILDIIFFKSLLYQNITGMGLLFFIRSFAEIFLFGAGLICGKLLTYIISQ